MKHHLFAVCFWEAPLIIISYYFKNVTAPDILELDNAMILCQITPLNASI